MSYPVGEHDMKAEIDRLRAAIDARDAAIKVAEEAPHDSRCNKAGIDLPGSHWHAFSYPLPDLPCSCWKSRFTAALAALAAAKEGK